ncbi:MAG: hypothetical protein LBL47_02470, partial [Lactobacillus sp.]|nr:hypothetical protein [Lactobacillus sp.]
IEPIIIPFLEEDIEEEPVIITPIEEPEPVIIAPVVEPEPEIEKVKKNKSSWITAIARWLKGPAGDLAFSAICLVAAIYFIVVTTKSLVGGQINWTYVGFATVFAAFAINLAWKYGKTKMASQENGEVTESTPVLEVTPREEAPVVKNKNEKHNERRIWVILSLILFAASAICFLAFIYYYVGIWFAAVLAIAAGYVFFMKRRLISGALEKRAI